MTRVLLIYVSLMNNRKNVILFERHEEIMIILIGFGLNMTSLFCLGSHRKGLVLIKFLWLRKMLVSCGVIQ